MVQLNVSDRVSGVSVYLLKLFSRDSSNLEYFYRKFDFSVPSFNVTQSSVFPLLDVKHTGFTCLGETFPDSR